MIHIFTVLMLCAGYYTLTYGLSLWRDDKNKLGGAATIIIAVIGTIAPVVTMYLKR